MSAENKLFKTENLVTAEIFWAETSAGEVIEYELFLLASDEGIGGKVFTVDETFWRDSRVLI